MKKFFLLIFIGTLSFCSCKAPISTQSGSEDIAYLIFTSPKKYWNHHVNVQIDDRTYFEAKVVKTKRNNRWGRQYGVMPGRRHIKVTYQDDVIYEKVIFLSTQENKIITLP